MSSVQLRGGHQTRDPRLDRIAQHDERNARYPMRALIETAQPLRSYTWRVPALFDQGSEGACVAYAIAHEAVARPRLALRSSVAQLLDDRSLYWGAQRVDPWDGGSYPGASPVYEGTSVLAGMQSAVSLGLFGSYHWAANELEVAETVGYRGPVVIGVDWYEGMHEPDSTGFIYPSGELLGGHATLVYGVSISGGYYKIHNSWGPDWGVGGTCRITRDDLHRLLSAPGGEACIGLA